MWKNNEIQFARLICEIVASVDTTDADIKALCESMDLSRQELGSLFVRAEDVWEEAKRKV